MLQRIILFFAICFLGACSPSTATPLDFTPQATIVSPSSTPPTLTLLPITPTSETLAAQITTIITPTIALLPTHTDAISNLDFVDYQHGWIMQGAFGETNHGYGFVGNVLLATSDGGLSWVQLPDPTFELTHLDFVSPTHGWATSPEGLQETTDGGRSWLPVPSENGPPEMVWRSQLDASRPCGSDGYRRLVRFLDQSQAWALCTGDPGTGFQSKRLFSTSDSGRTWQLIADSAGTPPNTDLSSFGYASDLRVIDMQHAWMKVGRVGITVTTDGGRTWTSSKPIVLDQPQVTAIAPVTPEHGFAIVNANTLIETTDGAQTWHQIYPPLHPFGPIFFTNVDRGIGQGVLLDDQATLQTTDGGRNWTLAPLTDKEQQELRRRAVYDSVWYTGTIAWKVDGRTQTLLRSEDNEASWQPIHLNQQVTSVSTAANDVIWVTASSRLLQSADRGKSWTEYRLGAEFAYSRVCFIDDQHGWLMAATHIYRTTNGGSTWTQLQ